ncbi:1-acyl-sn-glycerol-3-phosphate acyltransferase [Allochromatium humboldtianum]|uniref:1-acyl-sn-glycerol-3-phosphate acyltransferase n=1 Tax=Allochromatium humboldtianum TaxID=504901 RepID=A0A850R9I6_9GAMM|nr:lysophospholipid acyltransferase family protein [Allochromatium humboldtianum]NVZ09445.1 1-acyl-sn-glycerol-3-phosphate acyltransferase [Allochromatium humboldtianum]
MNTATLAATLLVGLTRLITGVRAQWIDRTPPVPGIQRVYFANHASHLDTLVIWSSLPPPLRRQTSPVAAMDYWNRPGPRRWLAVSVLHAILIERGTGGARESLRHLIAALDEGRSLILFPEGSRGDGEHIGELRAGLYHIARERPDVELTPVFLENLSRILPKGEYLPVPLIATTRFGRPIRLEPNEERQVFLERARQTLLALGGRA